MSEYRTPEEDREQRARIRTILDQAVHDAASLKAAMALDEPQDVVDLWTDRTWDGLGAALSDHDRLGAILMLLDGRINVECRRILRSVRGPS